LNLKYFSFKGSYFLKDN